MISLIKKDYRKSFFTPLGAGVKKNSPDKSDELLFKMIMKTWPPEYKAGLTYLSRRCGRDGIGTFSSLHPEWQFLIMI